MSNSREVSIDELFEMRGSDQAQAESRDRFTVRSGVYQFQAESYRALELEATSYSPSRVVIYLNGKVKDSNGKESRFSFGISPTEVRRADSNKLDGMSKLYNQVLTTFDFKASQTNPKDVIEAAMKYPVMLRVRESFKLDDGSWLSARMTNGDKEYGIALSDGTFVDGGKARSRYQASNFVDSVYKCK